MGCSCSSHKKPAKKDSTKKISNKINYHTINSAVVAKNKYASFPLVDSLKKLFTISDTMQHVYGNDDPVSDLTQKIAATLGAILSNPQITKQNIDSLLKCQDLGIVHSDDKKLWIFNWYENTGGSYRSNVSIIYCITPSGKRCIAHDDSDNGGGTGENRFVANGAWYNNIYKLSSQNDDLYLCTGSGVGCNTCVYATATVIQLTKDSANFSYPAFISDELDNSGEEKHQPYFLLGTRGDDIKDFHFDDKKQTLHFTYLTDDSSPIKKEENEKSKKIARKLIFNGKIFIGNGYE